MECAKSGGEQEGEESDGHDSNSNRGIRQGAINCVKVAARCGVIAADKLNFENTAGEHKGTHEHGAVHKQQKVAIIAPANGGANPRAVVVEAFNAVIIDAAMVSTRRLVEVCGLVPTDSD